MVTSGRFQSFDPDRHEWQLMTASLRSVPLKVPSNIDRNGASRVPDMDGRSQSDGAVPRSASEQLPHIREGLELERIARGVEKEHRRLLSPLAGKARVRFNHESDVVRDQPVGERLPVGGREDDAEMRYWHRMTIDRIMPRDRLTPIDAVRDDLVTVKVEIDPVSIAAPLGATEHAAVEMAGGVQVVDGKGDVKGGKIGHAACLPHPRAKYQSGTWVVRRNMLGARPC